MIAAYSTTTVQFNLFPLTPSASSRLALGFRDVRNTIHVAYCKLDREETGAWRPRGARARNFVNFRGGIHASRARRARIPPPIMAQDEHPANARGARYQRYVYCVDGGFGPLDF